MKKILHTIIVLCMFAGIAFFSNKVTVNRTGDGCIQLSDFYQLKEDTVDVLFVGSSHVYYSVNTCQLYDQYGMASYLMASPGQPVWIGYYLLEEALKTQKPQLIVYDVYTLYRNETEAGSWECLIGMKPSLTKWNAIKAVNEEGPLMDAAGAFFSFPYYHTRYAELTRQDFEDVKMLRYHGYKPDFHVIPKKQLKKWEHIDRTGFDQAEPVSERTEQYLRMFIELCRDKEIPLLLVNAPYANQMLEKQQAHNYVAQIAEEYDVPFIDGNQYIDQMQIDFSEDLVEVSHLNYYGGVKYTDFLAQWIDRHYEIPDRRGEESYQEWEEAGRIFYYSKLLRRRLKKIDNYEDYKEAVKELEDCVMICCKNPDGELGVYDSGEQVYAVPAGQEGFRHFDLGVSDLAVKRSNEEVSIALDQKEYAFADCEVNIFIYDKAAGQVIDAVGFKDGGKTAVRK